MTHSVEQLDAARHEYRFNWWMTSPFLLFGAAFIAEDCELIRLSVAKQDPSDFVLAVPFLFLGLYCLLLALRSRLIIYGNWIQVRYALSSKDARFNELEGYRQISRDKANFTVLYRKTGEMALAISHGFHTDDAYRQWIGRLKDLDELHLTPQ